MSAAAAFLRTHGFLVLLDALREEELEDLRAAAGDLMERIFEADPEGSFGGGAGKLPHRYSLGDASGTKSNFHLKAYAKLIDLPSTTPLLREIFGSYDYLAAGSGGDVALAGAIETSPKRPTESRAKSEEYQALHPDAIWGVLDRHVADYELPPAVTAPRPCCFAFVMVPNKLIHLDSDQLRIGEHHGDQWAYARGARLTSLARAASHTQRGAFLDAVQHSLPTACWRGHL